MKLMMLFLICLAFYRADAKSRIVRLIEALESELSTHHEIQLSESQYVPCGMTFVDNRGGKHEKVDAIPISGAVCKVANGDCFIYNVNVGYYNLMILADNEGTQLGSKHTARGVQMEVPNKAWSAALQESADRRNWALWTSAKSAQTRKHAGNRDENYTFKKMDFCPNIVDEMADITTGCQKDQVSAYQTWQCNMSGN